MIEMQKRAIYNILRMNWLLDKSLEIKEWQVTDYRPLSIHILFDLLKDCGLSMDRQSFLAFSENCDTPEELTDLLIGDSDLADEELDKIYLIVFELWRKLLPEKQSLSIFCDELDHQIYAYDTGNLKDLETIEDMIANLQMILEENVDQGVESHEAFALVASGCANDIESFLYDFIYQQIDNENYLYADELLEAFKDYIVDPKWFAYLQVRVIAVTDPTAANQYLRQLIKKTKDDEDFSFFVELITFLSHPSQIETFKQLVHISVPLIQIEDDFIDLLYASLDVYSKLSNDSKIKQIQTIIDKRVKNELEALFNADDKDLEQFLKIIE